MTKDLDTPALTAGVELRMIQLRKYKSDPESPSGIKSGITGRNIGYRRKDGYWVLSYGGTCILAHRAVFILSNSEIPKGMVIDHIDRNPSNNLIENLRCVTQSENLKNVIARPHSKSGVKLISFNKAGTFSVRIQRKTYGTFSTLEEAIRSRDEVLNDSI